MDGDNPGNEASHTVDDPDAEKREENNKDAEVNASPVNTSSASPGSRLSDRRQPTTNISQLCISGDDGGGMNVPVQDKSDLGARPKIRHGSGNNRPGVRGITIEGTGGDRPPILNVSPYSSPGGSPRFIADQQFNLPAPGPRVPNSISDNSLHSGGTRPKSAPRSTNDRAVSLDDVSGRRHTLTGERLRRRNRLMLASESLPEDPQSREVVEQSEEVMQNYMFERYNRDRQVGNVPESPTLLENFTRRPQTNVSALGRRLAAIGDEIDAKYHSEFQMMTKSLNISQGATEDAYEAFKGVAMKLFRSGLSMGRIVALLQFGYHLAIDVLRQGVGDFMSNIVNWLVRFITVERITNVINQTTQSIAEWLAGHGGWRGAVETLNRTILTESAPAIAVYVGACITLVAVVCWLGQR